MPSDDAIFGPYTVTVGDCPDPIFYRVQLLGTDGRKSSFRRYSDFAALASAAREALEAPPALPPRSFFRKHFLPGFKDRRRRELHGFLVALLAADPYCVHTPGLREFLGLPELPLPCEKSCDSPTAAPDRNLYTIMEGRENEEQRFRRSCSGTRTSIPRAEKAAATREVVPQLMKAATRW